MACLMSSRSFLDSSRIEHCPAAVDRFEEIAVPDGTGHDQVDVPLKQLPQRLQQAEVRVGILTGLERDKLDEEVQIARPGIETVRQCRPEELKPPNTVLGAQPDQVAAPFFNQAVHFFDSPLISYRSLARFSRVTCSSRAQRRRLAGVLLGSE